MALQNGGKSVSASPPSLINSKKGIESSPSNGAATQPSLADFWRLPQELRTWTLELACYNSLTKTDKVASSSNSWQLHLDVKTVAHLALVSREFYTAFNPLLYSRVRLTRPSELSSFRTSLLSRPDNAEHVTSLHLGPLSDLPSGWWPVSTRGEATNEDDPDDSDPQRLRPIVHFKTSLTTRDEARGLLPKWAKPERDWAHKRPPQDCQERAVCKAIKAALKEVDVDPYDHLADADGLPICIDDWTQRIFEAQAILDLYLGAMKQVEEEKEYSIRSWRSKKKNVRKRQAKCRSNECGHYPMLKLEGFGAEEEEEEVGSGEEDEEDEEEKGPACKWAKGNGAAKEDSAAAAQGDEDGQQVFVITRDQIKAHMSRPGSYTDHFDHPLMYARSDLQQLALDDKGKVIIDYEREQAEDFYGYSDDDEDDEEDSLFGSEWDSDDLDDEEEALAALFAAMMGEELGDELDEEEEDESESESEQESQQGASSSEAESDSSDESDTGSYSSQSVPPEFDSAESTSADESDSEVGSSSSSPSTSSSESSISENLDPTTRPGLIAISRTVLDLTTQVKNLSLTGYFHDSLDVDRRRLKVLDQLLSLSIGPLAPPSAVIHCLEEVRLPAMEKLRICGDVICRGTALQIAGSSKDEEDLAIWPSLKEAHWEFGHLQARTGHGAAEALQLFNVLAGREASDGSDEEGLLPSGDEEEQSRATEDNDTQDKPSALSRPRRYIQARIPPNFYFRAFSAAGNARVSDAWSRGMPVSNAANILHISQSEAVKEKVTASGNEEYRQDVGALRRDSLAWWGERAVESARWGKKGGEEERGEGEGRKGGESVP